MDIKKNSKDFLTKLQNLPEIQRKIILWTVVIIIALALGYFWVRGTVNNLQKINESISQVKIPSVQMPSADTSQTTTPTNK